METGRLMSNSFKHYIRPSSGTYPSQKTAKVHEKFHKALSMNLQSARDLKKAFYSKRIFGLGPDSTLTIEYFPSVYGSHHYRVEGTGFFRYSHLRKFLTLNKKYLRDVNIRIAGDISINDRNMKQFLKGFRTIYRLRHIDLEFSSFESAMTNQGLTTILHQLRVYPNLRVFSILCNGINNRLRDESMAHFAKVLRKKKGLEKLVLNLRGAENYITDRGLELFHKGLNAPILSLRTLRLDLRSFGIYNNKLSNNGAYYLSLALLKLVSLEDLFLDFSGGINGIGDEGLAKVAESLRCLKRLKRFTLDCQMGSNEVTSRGARILSECLKEVDCLNSIHLNFSNYPTMYGGDNSIGDRGFVYIFSLIANKPSFQEFILKASRNNISNYGLQELAKTASSMACPYKLECDLRGNENITDDSLNLFRSALPGLTANSMIIV